jgi:hypothetical protein
VNQLEAAFFYGDYSSLREFTEILLSEKSFDMWVQLELFT